MSLTDIRSDIIRTLQGGGLGDAVESHPGRLSADDLKTFVARGRSTIRVACLSVPRVEKRPGGTDVEIAWAAYVMAMDAAGISRDAAASVLATAVSLLVAGNLWGREDVDSPMQIRADNLYSGVVDKRAVALWAVTWRQTWTPETIDLTTLGDLLRVVVDYDVDTTVESEPAARDIIELAGGSAL
jgi:hypothetical protein